MQADQTAISRAIIKQQADQAKANDIQDERNLEAEKKQCKLNKALTTAVGKWSDSATTPRPILPTFKPNNIYNNYMDYKEWDRRW